MFCDVFSFPPGVYVWTLNYLIVSIPGPSILTSSIPLLACCFTWQGVKQGQILVK